MDLIKGLIKLAAAGVKAREGRGEGVKRHLARGIALLEQSTGSKDLCFGIRMDAVINGARAAGDATRRIVDLATLQPAEPILPIDLICNI